MTALSRQISRQDGYGLRCNGCKVERSWVPGRVGAARAEARRDGWEAGKGRTTYGMTLHSNTVWDLCPACVSKRDDLSKLKEDTW